MLVTDFLDAIKRVSETIKNVREIRNTVKTGIDYLKIQDPAVKEDVRVMCEELSKTCNAISDTSALITNFRFNSSPAAIQDEPTRFNENFVEFKTKDRAVEDHLNQLRGHCSKIRAHMEKYQQMTGGFGHVFNLRDLDKEHQIGDTLQKIFNEESQYMNLVFSMSEAVRICLNEVDRILLVDFMYDYNKVPEAAKTMAEYAAEFSSLENECNTIRRDLNDLIVELN